MGGRKHVFIVGLNEVGVLRKSPQATQVRQKALLMTCSNRTEKS